MPGILRRWQTLFYYMRDVRDFIRPRNCPASVYVSRGLHEAPVAVQATGNAKKKDTVINISYFSATAVAVPSTVLPLI